MPDDENQADVVENNDTENSNSEADQKTDTTNNVQEDGVNGEGENKGDEGDNDNPQKDNKEAKVPAKDIQDNNDDDNAPPPTRKRLSKADFIIGRQRAKLAKKQDRFEDTDDTESEDEEVAPEDEELITKVVAKQLAPIIEKSLEADDEQEIQDFLKEYPDLKSFEKQARKYMKDPSRRNLPIKSIFFEIAGERLIELGAKREREATAKAKETQTGGGSNRGSGNDKGVWDIPKDDFEAKQEKIRQGRQ